MDIKNDLDSSFDSHSINNMTFLIENKEDSSE
jgi:hypothetical protein